MNAQADLYLIALARCMRSEDVVHVGASQADVWLAAEVARRLWAPGLRLVAAGTYQLEPGCGVMERIRSRTYARDLMAAREATFLQSRVFDDLHRHRVTFAGALQVDVCGNANLIALEVGARTVRGPGSGGLPTLTSHADRFFIALPRHDARTFVGRVHRISVLGDRRRRQELALPPNSLQQVITPLASFVPGAAGLELSETSPGVTLTDIRDNTGFPITVHADFTERAPLTSDEKNVLERLRSGAP